jgi:hypothetical protein
LTSAIQAQLTDKSEENPGTLNEPAKENRYAIEFMQTKICHRLNAYSN